MTPEELDEVKTAVGCAVVLTVLAVVWVLLFFIVRLILHYT